MLTLIRSAVSLAVLIAVAYALFFVQIGGRPVVEHVMDVWRSPVMQEKVSLVTDEMKREIEARLAASERPPSGPGATPEFDHGDARALEQIVSTP